MKPLNFGPLNAAVETLRNSHNERLDGGSAELGYLYKVYKVGQIIRIDLRIL